MGSAYLVSFVLSLLLTVFMIPRILYFSIRKRLLDIPDKRKVHIGFCSRLGGVAFLPSIFLSVVITVFLYSRFNPDVWAGSITPKFILVICSCMLLYLVGLADDISGVRYRTKFVFQIFASFLAVISGIWIDNLYGIAGIGAIPAWIGIPLTTLLLVFIMNAVNLIDGIDGLASGLACVAFAAFAFFFIRWGYTTSALMALSTLGTLMVFFYFNVFGIAQKRYKIFMGDTGALVVGLLLGILAVRMFQYGPNSPAAMPSYAVVTAFSVLIVPCFDVLRVMFCRYRSRNPLFCPDKNHFHHKLLSLGFTHHHAMLFIICISVFFTLFNLLTFLYVNINWVILADVIIWMVMHFVLSRKIAARSAGIRARDLSVR